MKHLIIVVFLLCSLIAGAQTDIINESLADSSKNILYIGVENRIKVKGYNEEFAMVVTGGGGTCIKEDKNKYIVRANSVTTLCYLFITKGTKNIFRKNFEVRTIPHPIATIGGRHDTTVKLNVLLVNPFISVVMPGCYLRHNYSVVSFKATFIQNSDSTFTSVNGNTFSPEQIGIIKTLKTGDTIYFTDIRVLGPDSRAIKLSPFWIKIE